MNYYNTFIQLAPDSTAETAVVPPLRGSRKTVALLEHELLSSQPYVHTQEEILFLVHAQRSGLDKGELAPRPDELWAEFFSKPRACLRSSPLPKKYGWGIHFDAEGKAAIYAVESQEYRRHSQDPRVTQLFAMRERRA